MEGGMRLVKGVRVLLFVEFIVSLCQACATSPTQGLHRLRQLQLLLLRPSPR